MPKRSVLALKNYQIHAISTCYEGKNNANIASWVMQSAMKGKRMLVSLYQPDLTIELVRKSGILNVHLLGTHQRKLIQNLGKKSGREFDKLEGLEWEADFRGCPVLQESVGVIHCVVEKELEGYDHNYFECSILKQKVLLEEQEVMTTHWLKTKGIIR